MKLIVDNMTCAHCVKTITHAIKSIEPSANVSVDLAKHEVDIDSQCLSQEAAIAAINDAGFEFVGIAY